jgi:hypothetical protein
MNMKFGLNLDTDSNARDKAMVVVDMALVLEEYFGKKTYGDGVKVFYIKVMVLKPREGYEHLDKEKKPKYRPVVKYKTASGEPDIVNNLFEYDVKLSQPQYDALLAGTKSEGKRIIATALIESLDKLDLLIKKKVDFDVALFKQDFIEQLARITESE